MQIKTHFNELYHRFLYILVSLLLTFCTCFYYSEQIFFIFASPLLNIVDNQQFMFTNIIEVFLIYFKASFIISIYITYPYVVYTVYEFLKPGLYKTEELKLRFYLKISLILTLLSILITYYILIPTICYFFLNFDQIQYDSLLTLNLNAKLNEYIEFILQIFFMLTLSFQFPILLLLAIQTNIIDLTILIKYRNLIYFLVLIVSALISPPDVISLFIFIIPVFILYESTILYILYQENYSQRNL